MSLKEFLTGIANAIRKAKGTSSLIKASNFASQISELSDTSTATATAADILKGETAYAKGAKVTGTLVPLDTSDATATASAILKNYTAYVKGQKVTGALVPLDTSTATATAADILKGETAYAKGVKVTGIMTNNGAVTKTLDKSTALYTIPSGYHNGSGKVSISAETKTVTPSTSAQTIYPSAGKVITQISVEAIPNSYIYTSYKTTASLNSGSYTRSIAVTPTGINDIKYAFVTGQGVNNGAVVHFGSIYAGTNTTEITIYNRRQLQFKTTKVTTSATALTVFIIGTK